MWNIENRDQVFKDLNWYRLFEYVSVVLSEVSRKNNLAMCFIFVDFFLQILRLNFKSFILKIQKVDQVDFDLQ